MMIYAFHMIFVELFVSNKNFFPNQPGMIAYQKPTLKHHG